MKRCWSIPISFVVLLVVGLGITGNTKAEDGLDLPGKAHLLIDATTGQVLYDQNSHERLPIASITKIMTATLALERGNLSDVLTASQRAYETGGTTIYLEVGEQQTLQNLLYGLMLESGNDCAVAIAEGLGGTEAGFVEWMNQKAQEIGARDTHFANSHGLDDPDHYSTAYDMALIARYAMQNPLFRALVATEQVTIPGYADNPPRELHSHDQLLGYYDGANGVKNGYTDNALLTNVASARRGETELIAVVLGTQDRIWTSSMALMDYGFSHFRTEAVVKKGEPVATAQVAGAEAAVPALAAQDFSVTVTVGGNRPERRVVWDPGLKSPLPAGAHVGRLEELEDGKPLGQVDLVTAAAVGVSPQPAPAGTRSRSLAWMALLGVGTVLGLTWVTGGQALRRGRL